MSDNLLTYPAFRAMRDDPADPVATCDDCQFWHSYIRLCARHEYIARAPRDMLQFVATVRHPAYALLTLLISVPTVAPLKWCAP